MIQTEPSELQVEPGSFSTRTLRGFLHQTQVDVEELWSNQNLKVLV